MWWTFGHGKMVATDKIFPYLTEKISLTDKNMSKTLILAAGLISTNARLFSEDLKVQQYTFDQFKSEYGRTYSSPEEEKLRFGHL